MKAKALAKKRKPAQMEDQDYEEMVNEDRQEDPNSKNEEPLFTKDKIYMAKPKSEQTQSDYEAYQAEMNRRKVGKAINRYRNKGSK